MQRQGLFAAAVLDALALWQSELPAAVAPPRPAQLPGLTIQPDPLFTKRADGRRRFESRLSLLIAKPKLLGWNR